MTTIRSIVYVSTRTHDLTTMELEELLSDSRAFNAQHSVTGALLYSGLHFMQCFEGAPDDVQKVYERIKRSPQHKDIVEYMDGQVPQRAFGSWIMGLAKPGDSETLAFSTAQWSQMAQQAFSPESPAGPEMLKVFWNMRKG